MFLVACSITFPLTTERGQRIIVNRKGGQMNDDEATGARRRAATAAMVLYQTYYRAGDGRWHRAFPTQSKQEAIDQVASIRRGGREAYYADKGRLDSIGLPDEVSY